jgi:trimethylamine:corrinoid methyltransferase-like protein
MIENAHFRRISAQQCEKLHNASLKILERTGVLLFEPEAIDLLKKAGASVSDGNRVGALATKTRGSAVYCTRLGW